MNKIILIVSLVFSISLLANEMKFFKTSYKCTNTKTNTIEYKICTDKELVSLDTILNTTYKSFRLVTQEIKQDQRAWLKERNRCKSKECIKDSYLLRTKELLVSLKGQKTFPQKVLDAMESIEKNKLLYIKDIHLVIVPITPKDNGFKDNLFHFQNFTFIKPIKSNIFYNDEDLKNYLGECYGYEIYKVPYAERKLNLINGVKVGKLKFPLLSDEDNYRVNLKFSIYNTVKLKGKKYYLLDDDGYFFIIDKERCASFGKKHKFSITEAFNADIIQKSYALSGKFYLVKYKKKLAVLNIFGNSYKSFNLYALLGNDGRANKNLFVYKRISTAWFLDKNDISYKSYIKQITEVKKLKNKQGK